MLHTTFRLSVPLSVILTISFSIMLTLDLSDWITHCNSCNNFSGMVLKSGPLDLLSEDTSVEVFKDMGDFVDDEDLTPFKIAFYRGVCDEEISEEDMVSSTTRSAILEKTRATLMRI